MADMEGTAFVPGDFNGVGGMHSIVLGSRHLLDRIQNERLRKAAAIVAPCTPGSIAVSHIGLMRVLGLDLFACLVLVLGFLGVAQPDLAHHVLAVLHCEIEVGIGWTLIYFP